MIDLIKLDRRALLGRAMLLVGASVTAGYATPTLAQLAAAPLSLQPGEMALLNAVADTIIPRTTTGGAVDAGVPAKFDALLTNWAAPTRRAQLLAALSEIDALAQTAQGKSFADLTEADRKALLVPHDVASLRNVPRPPGPANIAAMMAGPLVANPGYGKMKELILLLYYTSELGLTQELSYEHAPGQWQPSIPVTAETRVAGGGVF